MEKIAIRKYIFGCFVIIFLVLSIKLVAQKDGTQGLLLMYVDFDIMTTVDISCSEFDIAFKDTQLHKQIICKYKIEKFLALLSKLEKDNTSKSIDTRAKIKLNYKNHKEEICLNRFNVLSNGQLYKMNKDLMSFIEVLKKARKQ